MQDMSLVCLLNLVLVCCASGPPSGRECRQISQKWRRAFGRRPWNVSRQIGVNSAEARITGDENTPPVRCRSNAGSGAGQRRRRWPSPEPALDHSATLAVARCLLENSESTLTSEEKGECYIGRVLCLAEFRGRLRSLLYHNNILTKQA